MKVVCLISFLPVISRRDISERVEGKENMTYLGYNFKNKRNNINAIL